MRRTMSLLELGRTLERVRFKQRNSLKSHAVFDGTYVYVSPAMLFLLEGANEDDNELEAAGKPREKYELMCAAITVILKDEPGK